MNIICIDPSKRSTGIYLRHNGQIDWLSIKTSAKLNTEQAGQRIIDELKNIFHMRKFNVGFIEGYGMNPKNRKSMFVLPEIVGVIKNFLFNESVPIITIPVQTWKSLTIGSISKYNKQAYLKAVDEYCGILFENTDEADAFLIYKAAMIIAKKTKYVTKGEKEIKEKMEKIIENRKGEKRGD